MKKVSNKISIIILILLSFSFIAFSVFNYKEVSLITNTIAKDSRESSTFKLKAFVAGYLDSKVYAVQSFANYIAKNPQILEDRQKLHNEIMDAAIVLGFEEFYVGFEDNGNIYNAVLQNGELKKFHLTPERDNYDTRMRDWFKLAKNSGKLSFTEPYKSNMGSIVITIATPIFVNNKFIGVFAGDIAIDSLTKNIKELKDSPTNEISLFDMNSKNLIYHPNNDLVMSNKNEARNLVNDLMQNLKMSKDGTFVNDDIITSCQRYETANWAICSSNSMQDHSKALNSILADQIIVFDYIYSFNSWGFNLLCE